MRAVAALVLAATLVVSVGASGIALGATSTEVSIEPSSQTISSGETTTFDIVVESTDGAVGATDVDLALTNPDVAAITEVSIGGDAGFSNTDVADDGSTASFQAVYGNNPIEGDSPTIATVTVEGTAEGETDLEITSVDLSDEPGNSYDVTGANSATLTVEPADEPEPEPEPAVFGVSSLNAPSEAAQGESIAVSATVSNDGDEAGTQTVSYQLDDQTLAEEEVTLDAGASETVTFDVTVPSDLEPGTYTHGVYTDDDSATADIEVEAAPDEPSDPAGPSTELSLSPDQQTVSVGATTTFDVVVESADGGVGAVDLSVSVDDTDTAEIVDIDTEAPESFEDATVAGDGSSASVQAIGLDTADSGPVTVATVTVEGMTVDEADLSVSAEAIGTEDGEQSYQITETNGATLTVVPADFLVSNLDAPDSVVRGETVTATADVTNDGILETTKEVEFRLDLNGDGTLSEDEVVATEEVTLEGGETQEVSLTATVPADLAPGEYAHGVFTPDDDETATIDVTLPLIDESYAGPPQDPDGDGLYEDVNGDGEVNVNDVQALFVNRDSGVVSENSALFDYNGDGQFDVVDIQNLFAQVTA